MSRNRPKQPPEAQKSDKNTANTQQVRFFNFDLFSRKTADYFDRISAPYKLSYYTLATCMRSLQNISAKHWKRSCWKYFQNVLVKNYLKFWLGRLHDCLNRDLLSSAEASISKHQWKKKKRRGSVGERSVARALSFFPLPSLRAFLPSATVGGLCGGERQRLVLDCYPLTFQIKWDQAGVADCNCYFHVARKYPDHFSTDQFF